MTILLKTLLLQASGQSPYGMLIFMLLLIVVFYFFMIRPQVKRQKELSTYRSQLKKGDKVITTGGIYGKVQEVNDQSISLEIDNNVHIKVDKSAVLKDSSDLVNQK